MVLIEMGRKPTGGYLLGLKDNQARLLDDTAQVSTVWVEPAPGAIVTQVVTSPWVLIALPKNASYSRVQVVDQNGRIRLSVAADGKFTE